MAVEICEPCAGTGIIEFEGSDAGGYPLLESIACPECVRGMALVPPAHARLIVRLFRAVSSPAELMSSLSDDERSVLADACACDA